MANVAIPAPVLGGAGKIRRVWATGRRYPLFSLAILIFMLVLPGIFANQITDAWLQDPLEQKISERLIPPAWQEGGTWTHPLGTDKVGFDIASRIIHGARVSLIVAGLSIFTGGFIGTVLGLLAGYFGGWWDHIIMRLVDIKLSLQSILLALVLVAVLGPGFLTVIIVISLVLWVRYARLVRGETLALKNREFVLRSRVAGAFYLQNPQSSSLPQRSQHPHRSGYPGSGAGNTAGSRIKLPGRGNTQTHASLGVDGGRRKELNCSWWWLVDIVLPRDGNYADRAFDELVGRLAPGQTGPQAAEHYVD